MFGKLMKYNMKEVGMVMLPIYLAMAALSVALGITQRYSIMRGPRQMAAAMVPGTITLILFVVLGVLTFAMAIVTLVMIVRNFRDNLLGNRGYLTNTLPATMEQHVLGKLANGTLWMVFGGAAAFLSGMIVLSMSLTKADWNDFFTSFRETFDGKISLAGFIAQFAVLLVVEGIQIIAKLYLSIALGNLWRGHRGLGAVLIFVAVTIGQNLLTSWLSHVTADASISYALMGTGFRMVFGAGDNGSLLTARQMGIYLGLDGAYIVVFTVLTITMLKRKLDLE